MEGFDFIFKLKIVNVVLHALEILLEYLFPFKAYFLFHLEPTFTIQVVG